MCPALLFAFVLLGGGDAALKEKGTFVETAMPPVPEMNIRHRFGERTFLKAHVCSEPDTHTPHTGSEQICALRSMSVPFARLKLGFEPWAAGADGVVCDVPDELAEAKEGAACDVALLDRMREVQRIGLKERDPDRRLAGRKLGGFLANLNPSGDPDLQYLEALMLLRQAEKTLGLAPTPLVPYVRDSVAGKLPWQVARAEARSHAAAKKWTRKTQKAPAPEMEKWTQAEMSCNRPVTFAPGISVTWYNAHLLRFYVTATDKASIRSEQIYVKLWVPDIVHEHWLVYEVAYRPVPDTTVEANGEVAGLAPNPCRWLYVWRLRYPKKSQTCSAQIYAPNPQTTWRRTRLWGRDYPFPHSASGYVAEVDGQKRFEWTFVPGDFFDQRPMMKPGFRDSWFAEVRHTDANGAVRTGQVRILWPAGGPNSVLAAGDSLPFETYQTKVKPLYERVRERWAWGSDDRFYRDFVQGVLDADNVLLEKTYTHCGSPPPILKEVPAVRLKFYREIPRILFAEERIEQLRKQYLVDLLEGREPTPPKLKKPTVEKTGTSEPDADEGEKMELDEEVF